MVGRVYNAASCDAPLKRQRRQVRVKRAPVSIWGPYAAGWSARTLSSQRFFFFKLAATYHAFFSPTFSPRLPPRFNKHWAVRPQATAPQGLRSCLLWAEPGAPPRLSPQPVAHSNFTMGCRHGRRQVTAVNSACLRSSSRRIKRGAKLDGLLQEKKPVSVDCTTDTRPQAPAGRTCRPPFPGWNVSCTRILCGGGP